MFYDAKSQPVDPVAARHLVEMICATEEFIRSPQLSRFLRFVADETLAGRSDRTKAYTIGTMALGRRPDFDANTDSIVRVEAKRLRDALDRYNLQHPDARYRIVMPKGAYKLEFLDQKCKPVPMLANTHRLILSCIAAICVAVLITVAAATIWCSGDVAQAGPSLQPRVALSVAPPNAPDLEPLGEKAAAALRSSLPRFDEISVIEAGAGDPDYSVSIRAVREVSGLICIEATIKDEIKKVIVASLRRAIREPDQFQAVADRISTQIAEPFGVIVNHMAAADSPDRRCLVDAIRSRFSFDEALYEKSSICLTTLANKYPNNPLPVAYLAMNDAIQSIRLKTSMQESRTQAERALARARQAQMQGPDSARAHQAMARAHFLNSGKIEALTAIRTAADINPLDPTIQAEAGVYLLAAGKWQEARQTIAGLCNRSFRGPDWYSFYCYAADRLIPGALRETSPDYAALTHNRTHDLTMIARMLLNAEEGDRQGAQDIWRALVERDADWRDNRSNAWARRAVPPSIAQRFDDTFILYGVSGAP